MPPFYEVLPPLHKTGATATTEEGPGITPYRFDKSPVKPTDAACLWSGFPWQRLNHSSYRVRPKDSCSARALLQLPRAKAALRRGLNYLCL
ncbi:hypothetical protein LEMLEM_LOCUS1277 [Lemmus lemmus]